MRAHNPWPWHNSPWCAESQLLCLCLQGRTFIDRDPAHFGLILNFLRDGTCVLPTTAQGLQELLQEAEFYQVWLTSSYRLATQAGPS